MSQSSDNEEFDLLAISSKGLMQELIAAEELIIELKQEMQSKDAELNDFKNKLRAKDAELYAVKEELEKALRSKSGETNGDKIKAAYYKEKYEETLETISKQERIEKGCKKKIFALRVKLAVIEDNDETMKSLKDDLKRKDNKLEKLENKLVKMANKYKNKKLKCNEIAKDRDEYKADCEKKRKDVKILLNLRRTEYDAHQTDNANYKATIEGLMADLASHARESILSGSMNDRYKRFVLQTKNGNISRTQICYCLESIKDELGELLRRKNGIIVGEFDKIADVIQFCKEKGIITGPERKAMNKLNVVRNKLVHLRPTGLSHGGIIQCVKDGVKALNDAKEREMERMNWD